jgi:hypothetical protein
MENLIVGLGAFVAGVVFSYLFLRANPNKKRAVDTWVDENKPK